METVPATVREIASGSGWRVRDVVCHAKVGEPAFEERHERHVFAVVKRGVFNYHGHSGRALLHGGALLLGNQGCCYACGHSHSDGDECIALQLDDALYSEIAATQAGMMDYRFPTAAMPVDADVFASAIAFEIAMKSGDELQRSEAVIRFAETVLQNVSQGAPRLRVSVKDERRVGDVVQFIEAHIDEALPLDALANRAGLSAYHFLRVFKGYVGLSPHQYILKRRLKLAVDLLLTTKLPIIEVGLSSGFGDLSTFNKTFKAHTGKTPRMLRQ